MTALITRRGFEGTAVDMFCGAGGTSQGLRRAGLTVLLAANHNQKAIDTHARNFPDTEHLRADLVDVDNKALYRDPASLPAATVLWGSPSCVFHSRARAKKIYAQGPDALFDDPEFDEAAFRMGERSRVTMLCLLRYARHHRPPFVLAENVIDTNQWGPGRNGATFRWWLNEWKVLGYDYKNMFFNSRFFGSTPQSRDRWYFAAWPKGNTAPDLDYRRTAYCTSDACSGSIVRSYQSWKPRTARWPLPQWGEYGQQYVYRCEECRAEVVPASWPVASIIDWGNLGVRIGDRSARGMRPLAPNTMERLRFALAKMRSLGVPLMVPAKGRPKSGRPWGRDGHVLAPLPTQTTQQVQALVNAQLIKNYGGRDEAQYRSQHVSLPMGSVTTSDSHGLAISDLGLTPMVTSLRGSPKPSGQKFVHEPMDTITAGGSHHGLISDSVGALFIKNNGGPGATAPHPTWDPVGTITSWYNGGTGFAAGSPSLGLPGVPVLPWIEQYQSSPVAVTEQIATVMTHLRHALAVSTPSDEPVTDADLENLMYRMFTASELQLGMGFESDYEVLGSNDEKVALLGAAVTPPVPEWIAGQCIATLAG